MATSTTTWLPPALAGRLGGSASEARLPERVRSLIGQQELASERLIGWAQLFLAGILAALYLLAPAPSDAAAHMFQPVPAALSLYGLFTLVRLLASYRGRLSRLFLLASIIADMALLLGLIWSFHIQYGQPAAFSLKVPTFIYVFVFIALRALRFDPRFVLAAGLTAAFGWGLVVYLVLHDREGSDLTRSFVTYMTGNHVLLGAEFDKIITILLVTAILTFAVWRARRTLVSAVREESAKRDIGRFLSAGLAEAIAGSDQTVQAGDAAERQAAILMLDIRGFTAFSTSVPPRRLVEMLTGFHARVLPVIRDNGGVIDKFLGDGVMATFGAVKPSETAAADALRALEAIMAEARDWSAGLGGPAAGAGLKVNGAVAAGQVVFAVLGSADRLEYTVIGEPVNLAAKLEKHNKAEGSAALTTRKVLKLAQRQGFVPAREPERRRARQVAGVEAPLDLVVLA